MHGGELQADVEHLDRTLLYLWSSSAAGGSGMTQICTCFTRLRCRSPRDYYVIHTPDRDDISTSMLLAACCALGKTG